MPAFLEKELKAKYGAKSDIPYKIMNSIGAMRGNRETPKGREMEEKHEAKMKAPALHSMRIEIHRGPKNVVTGHTVHHEMMPSKQSPGGAFMEETHHSFPFDANGQSATHGDMMYHISEHLGMGHASDEAENDDKEVPE